MNQLADPLLCTEEPFWGHPGDPNFMPRSAPGSPQDIFAPVTWQEEYERVKRTGEWRQQRDDDPLAECRFDVLEPSSDIPPTIDVPESPANEEMTPIDITTPPHQVIQAHEILEPATPRTPNKPRVEYSTSPVNIDDARVLGLLHDRNHKRRERIRDRSRFRPPSMQRSTAPQPDHRAILDELNNRGKERPVPQDIQRSVMRYALVDWLRRCERPDFDELPTLDVIMRALCGSLQNLESVIGRVDNKNTAIRDCMLNVLARWHLEEQIIEQTTRRQSS